MTQLCPHHHLVFFDFQRSGWWMQPADSEPAGQRWWWWRRWPSLRLSHSPWVSRTSSSPDSTILLCLATFSQRGHMHSKVPSNWFRHVQTCLPGRTLDPFPVDGATNDPSVSHFQFSQEQWPTAHGGQRSETVQVRRGPAAGAQRGPALQAVRR